MAITKQELDQAQLDLVMGWKKHVDQLRRDSNKLEEWKAAERAYRNDIDDFYAGVAKVRVPALHDKVEIVVPRLDKTVFDPIGKFFEARALDKKDDLAVEDATKVTALITQQFKEANIRSKFIAAWRCLCIYGTVIIHTFWERKKQKRFKRVNGERKEVFEVVYDNPDFYIVPIWDFFIDPKDEKMEGFVIERAVKDWHELKAMVLREEDGEEVGIYDEEALNELKDKRVIDTKDSEKKESEENKGLGNHRYSEHEHKIDLLKMYGPIPKWLVTGRESDKDSGEIVENGLIEVASVGEFAKVVRTAEDNPFDHLEKPYLAGNYLKVEGNFYGLGVMTVNIPLQMELNTLRSQLMDLRSFILKKKWLIDRDANINKDQLKDLHNVIIDTDDVNGIRDIAPADFGGTALPQEAIIKQDIEDSTGATKLLGGTPTGSSLDRTATGVSLVAQGGLERMELVVTQFEEDILKPLVRHFWMLNQQFLPEGRDVAIIGDEIIRVVPSEIAVNGMDLIFTGIRELGEKAFKINNLGILIQNVTSLANFGLDPIPIVLKQIKMLGFEDLIPEIDKRPESQLEEVPEGEAQLLLLGRNVRINLNDDHVAFLEAYERLIPNKLIQVDPLQDPAEYSKEFISGIQNSQLPENVRRNLAEAVGQRLAAIRILNTGFKKTEGLNE